MSVAFSPDNAKLAVGGTRLVDGKVAGLVQVLRLGDSGGAGGEPAVKAGEAPTETLAELERLKARFSQFGGGHKHAIASYPQQIKENPGNSDLHLGLGQAFASQSQFREAAASLQKAIDLNPKYPALRQALAGVLIDHARDALQKGNWDEAAEAARQTLVHAPTNAPSHLLLAQILAQKKEIEAAAKHMKEAQASGQHDSATASAIAAQLFQLGNQARPKMEHDWAIEQFRLAAHVQGGRGISDDGDADRVRGRHASSTRCDDRIADIRQSQRGTVRRRWNSLDDLRAVCGHEVNGDFQRNRGESSMSRTTRFAATIAVIAWLPGLVAAQQTVAALTEQLQRLRADKEHLDRQLRTLRDGNSAGILFGYFRERGGLFTEGTREFVPSPQGTSEIPAGCYPIVLPKSLKQLSDYLTIEIMAGQITRENAVGILAHLRIGAAAQRVKAVREGIERAERDYLAQLKVIDAAIASTEFARGFLASGANPPADNPFPRFGSGVLKDEQGMRPVGRFDFEKDGQRFRLTLAYAPDNKIVATESSIDPVAKTVDFRFEYHLPEEVGKLKTRGPAKLDSRTNKVTLTTEEVFDSDANVWRGIPKQTSTHTLVWEDKLDDQLLVSKSGKLEAEAGKNSAEISFAFQQRTGASYSFELKAPATRLTMRVEAIGGSKSNTRSMPERGKPARFVASGPNQGVETYRITIIGVGANLPANYELEVWERWRVNGNIPPLNWDSESGQ